MLKKKHRLKIRQLNMNKHKAMRIPCLICQTNKKLFVKVNKKIACTSEFSDHLWIPFLNKRQSDVVFFAKLLLRYIKIL